MFCMQHGQWVAILLPVIGPSMWTVLAVLHQEGAMPTLQLIDTVWPGRDYGAAAGPIGRLVTAQMIERVPQGRIRLLQLTQFGLHVVTWARTD